MIVWLTRELNMRGRIIVTAIIGTWMIMMMVLTIWYNQLVIREMQREFSGLQQEHKYMQHFMEQNIDRFAKTIDQNTQQTKQNLEVIKQTVGPDK